MSHADMAWQGRSVSYREMAAEIRDLVPLLLHSQTAEDLRSLAARYERVADFLEASSSVPPLRRQAG